MMSDYGFKSSFNPTFRDPAGKSGHCGCRSAITARSSPCAYTLLDPMGATHYVRRRYTGTAVSQRPEYRFQQFGYCRRAWDDDIERLQRAAWRGRRVRRMRTLELAS